MKIKDFFDLYQEPESIKFKVWAFVIDKAISFDDVNDLYFFYPHILDKEITDFTIVNQLDYDIEPKYAREGINVYPKTIVYIYTEDWNKYEKNRC